MRNYMMFKASFTPDLSKTLLKHSWIRKILEDTTLSLDKILRHCALEIPPRYELGVSWVTHSDLKTIKIETEHRDYIEKILKFAWLYIGKNSGDELLYSSVSRELAMFEAGRELQVIHQQRIHASKQKRPWKTLDEWIARRLRKNITATNQELWDALPKSYDEEMIYRDGSDLFCRKKSRNPIRFRAFCNHVQRVKAKIKCR